MSRAANQEGSLKNQLQRLRAHMEYKNTACGENWVETERCVLKAVSGKIDTIVCTASTGSAGQSGTSSTSSRS